MKKWVLPLLALCIFILFFFLLEGVAIDYWDTYIALPATFISGMPGVIVDEAGQAVYDYNLSNRMPDDLIGKGSYGIISKDQRIGAGVTFAPPYLAFGVIGFRIFYALFAMLGFLLAYKAGRALQMSEPISIALGLILSINPLMLMMNRLNANGIAVSILIGLFAILLAQKPSWFFAGLIFGALGGIRNEAIMIVPALCLFFLTTKEGRRGIFLFGGGAVLGIAPYLAWNKFAFGKALIHSSQFSDFEGWRPEFHHEILGWEFKFNGLFNWPFHDHLVRTPHYPFPTYLTLPLVLTLCFGVLLMSFFLLGAYAQWRKDKRIAGTLYLWIFFCLGLFLFQENWEVPKTTFVALNVPAMAILMARGIEWLIEGRKSRRRWIALAVILILLESGVIAARFMEVPVDERWYVRFPKAKVEAAKTGCLNDLQRREWMYFHTDECQAELDEQRAKLTKGNLLPRFYYPIEFRPGLIPDEWGNREPRIFDIWEKIYGD